MSDSLAAPSVVFVKVYSPPLFGKFGTDAKDLFKKKFEFDPITFKTIRKAANGLSVESGAVSVAADAKKAGYLQGYSKFTVARAAWGSAELELHTDAAQTTKASAKFATLYPGFIVDVALASKDKADFFKGAAQVGSGEATYSQKNLQGKLTAKSDFAAKHKADASLTVGHEAWSAGASASFDSDHGHDVQDVQFGGEYTQDDVTLSVYSSTDKAARFVNASYFQRVNRDLAAAGLFKVDTASNNSTLTLGTDYRVDVDTGVKTKLELPKGTLQVAVEHRLASPQALVGAAAEFDVSNPQQPVAGRFGFAFTFGDF